MTRAQYGWPALDLVDSGIKRFANAALPFYRAHPYRGALWLSEIDMRVDFSTQHRFLFNRLPKNANSTINLSLVRASIGPDAALPAFPKRHFIRPSRLARKDITDVNGYFKFVFVRNPYTRTLSAYLDKIGNRRPQSRAFFKWLASSGYDTPTFELFCHYLDDVGLFHDNHWAPQTEGLVLSLSAFDFIGRFETLARDLNTVHEQVFSRPLPAPVRDGPRATGSDGLTDSYYTPATRKMIRRLFQADFETMGYRAA